MEETGKKVRRTSLLFRHPEHPFLFANVDRIIVGEMPGWNARQPLLIPLTTGKTDTFPNPTSSSATITWQSEKTKERDCKIIVVLIQ